MFYLHQSSKSQAPKFVKFVWVKSCDSNPPSPPSYLLICDSSVMALLTCTPLSYLLFHALCQLLHYYNTLVSDYSKTYLLTYFITLLRYFITYQFSSYLILTSCWSPPQEPYVPCWCCCAAWRTSTHLTAVHPSYSSPISPHSTNPSFSNKPFKHTHGVCSSLGPLLKWLQTVTTYWQHNNTVNLFSEIVLKANIKRIKQHKSWFYALMHGPWFSAYTVTCCSLICVGWLNWLGHRWHVFKGRELQILYNIKTNWQSIQQQYISNYKTPDLNCYNKTKMASKHSSKYI